MVMKRTLCFDSAQLIFLLSRSAQKLFHKPNTCRLSCQHWICMCVSLSESYFCDSLALMASQKPLIPVSCPVLLLSPELTHTSCVFQDATWLTDGLLADQEVLFPPGLSWLLEWAESQGKNRQALQTKLWAAQTYPRLLKQVKAHHGELHLFQN